MEDTIRKNEKAYKANPDFLIREVADEHLLVPTGDAAKSFGGAIIMLNETGSFIWKNLQDYCTLDMLVEKAKKEFEDYGNFLEQQINEFVVSMIKAGLIEERG